MVDGVFLRFGEQVELLLDQGQSDASVFADIKSVIDTDPVVKERLIATAQIPNPGGPAEFAKSIDEQRDVLAKAAKDLGIAAKQ